MRNTLSNVRWWWKTKLYIANCNAFMYAILCMYVQALQEKEKAALSLSLSLFDCLLKTTTNTTNTSYIYAHKLIFTIQWKPLFSWSGWKEVSIIYLDMFFFVCFWLCCAVFREGIYNNKLFYVFCSFVETGRTLD